MTARELQAAARVFRLMAEYADLRAQALMYRAAGEIDKALARESQCAVIYKQIPESQR